MRGNVSSGRGLTRSAAGSAPPPLTPLPGNFAIHSFSFSSLLRLFRPHRGDISDALIISLIVLASCVLSFSQEYRASKTMESLRRTISTKVTVLRDGKELAVPVEDVVPGDIVKLSAGNLIPS